jgi:uncharacterized protein HemX
MSVLVSGWALAIVLGASLILQGVVLRAAYRRKAARRQARHLQFQQTMTRQADQAKRQIGQLQSDLAAARLQLKQVDGRNVASMQGRALAKQALERGLDDATVSRYSLPVDGFADTQPSSPRTHHGSLLLQ